LKDRHLHPGNQALLGMPRVNNRHGRQKKQRLFFEQLPTQINVDRPNRLCLKSQAERQSVPLLRSWIPGAAWFYKYVAATRLGALALKF